MKQKRFNWELVISLFALLVSVVTAVLSYHQSDSANATAKRANQLSMATFAQDFLYERYMNSADLTNQSFDELWKDSGFKSSYLALKNRQPVEDYALFDSGINVLESVGSRYCQGLVFRADVALHFKKMLQQLCVNDRIIQRHGGEKNMVSYLCTQFVPDSGLAARYKTDPTCTPAEDPKELQKGLQNTLNGLLTELLEIFNVDSKARGSMHSLPQS